MKSQFGVGIAWPLRNEGDKRGDSGLRIWDSSAENRELRCLDGLCNEADAAIDGRGEVAGS